MTLAKDGPISSQGFLDVSPHGAEETLQVGLS